jgi:hypothetical protein
MNKFYKKNKLLFSFIIFIIILVLVIIIYKIVEYFIYYKKYGKKITLIIPVTKNDYSYIYDILKKMELNKNCKMDIHLIFSNEGDFEEFDDKKNIKYLILPPDVDTSNMITYKIFYALEQLKNSNYDYFICSEPTIDIVEDNFNKENIINKINEIFENKIIYFGKSGEKEVSTETSTGLIIDEKDIQKISRLTNNYTNHFLYSNLEVYDRKHLNNFFEKINYKQFMNGYHKSYIIYSYYLLLYENFKFINYTPLIKFDKSLNEYKNDDINNFKKLTKIKYGFPYIHKCLFNKDRNFFVNQGTFLIHSMNEWWNN